jgi:hypothetical protein
MPKTEVPSVLSYPRVQSLEETPELNGIFVYVVRRYALDGLAVVAIRNEDGTTLKFGDWDGNELSSGPLVDSFLREMASKLLTLMYRTKIEKIQYYISNGVLVDARTGRDTFLGPGMVKDVFGRVVHTQSIIGKPIILTKENLDLINSRTPPYDEPIIIKATSFKTIVRGNEMLPMYATVG